MKKCFMVLLSFSMVLTVLVGCGPSNRDLANRQRLAEERKVIMTERQMKLKEQVADRIAMGEVQPKKLTDPGDEIVNCINPKPRDGSIGFTRIPAMGMAPSNVICGNTKGGQEILEWRRWYCKGQPENCVFSEWKDEQPTFGETMKDFVEIKLPSGIIKLAPGNTLSPK